MIMETYRDAKFWYKSQFKADLLKVEDVGDLSMGGVLDDNVERRSCLKLVVVGPILDGYLNQMGIDFLKRLRHGKATGIVESRPFFFSFAVFIQFVKMVKAYGGNFDFVSGKCFVVKINKQSTTGKLFHPIRLGGVNYPVRRSFKKTGGRLKYRYDGQSRVVVMENTPITVTYKVKLQTCKLSFFVQRYNHLDEPVDIRLQAILNGGS